MKTNDQKKGTISWDIPNQTQEVRAKASNKESRIRTNQSRKTSRRTETTKQTPDRTTLKANRTIAHTTKERLKENGIAPKSANNNTTSEGKRTAKGTEPKGKDNKQMSDKNNKNKQR
ncbi:hypothetical protein [Bacteroides graminisolvens]|uniref:hypothetical protein n=1 Tax=Bacteroides graminisolvens TaxID=477666 RepID=UPI0004194D18|nr:hypothetical protein [Bacteroides graminisolvens]